MIRWTATLVSALVIVFSLTFIVTRRTAPEAPANPRLVGSPAAAGAPLRVRTLREAPPLPPLRRAPSAKAAVAASAATGAPAPPAAAPGAPVILPPTGSAAMTPPQSMLCARAAWAQLTGGAPALPGPGRC